MPASKLFQPGERTSETDRRMIADLRAMPYRSASDSIKLLCAEARELARAAAAAPDHQLDFLLIGAKRAARRVAELRRQVAVETSGVRVLTSSDLIEAGTAGLLLSNPLNGSVFRAAFVECAGISGVRIFDHPSGRRPAYDPIMSRDEIDQWLSGLERAEQCAIAA